MDKTVIIFGTSITSAYLSGATMLFRALAHAFIRKGWKVTFIEEYHSWLGAHTDYDVNIPGLKVFCYSDRKSLVKLLSDEKLFEGVRLVLKFSGSSISHDHFVDEWFANNKKDTADRYQLVYVDADAPMRVPYITGHPNFYLHSIISQFDGIWIMLGGQRAVKEYLAMGAKQAWFLSAAIDVESFQPKEPANEFRCDLLFIGNPMFGREQSLKKLFFNVAERCPDMNFLLSGAEWDSVSLPSNVRYTRYIPSERLPELYSSARLVLNVTREEMAAYGDAAALRLFEATICGACLISDFWQGLDTLFTPEQEILIVKKNQDVVRYLQTVDWSQSRIIGQRARARTLRDHTADIRVSEFLSLLENNQANRKP